MNAHDPARHRIVEEYLDGVEQALIRARAPRADRLLVLQELETQWSETIAQLPLPITEAVLHEILGSMEPPEHFADSYDEKDSYSTKESRYSPWLWIAGIAALGIPVAFVCLFTHQLTGAMSGPIFHPFVVLIFFPALLAGFVGTPLALARAIRELRQSEELAGRNECVRLSISVVTSAVAFVVYVVCLLTSWQVLIPIGLVAVLIGIFKLGDWTRLRIQVALKLSSDTGEIHAHKSGASQAIQQVCPA